MKKVLLIILLFLPTQVLTNQNITDEEIKKLIIQQSISSYPGPCACPYSATSRGHRCGGRSAYSKPGGYSPICYGEQITESMIKEFNKKLQ